MVEASHISNMAAYLPTDCPTREKHGWLGDALVTLPADSNPTYGREKTPPRMASVSCARTGCSSLLQVTAESASYNLWAPTVHHQFLDVIRDQQTPPAEHDLVSHDLVSHDFVSVGSASVSVDYAGFIPGVVPGPVQQPGDLSWTSAYPQARCAWLDGAALCPTMPPSRTVDMLFLARQKSPSLPRGDGCSTRPLGFNQGGIGRY